jgi:hypothetical protein
MKPKGVVLEHLSTAAASLRHRACVLVHAKSRFKSEINSVVYRVEPTVVSDARGASGAVVSIIAHLVVQKSTRRMLRDKLRQLSMSKESVLTYPFSELVPEGNHEVIDIILTAS